jgi:beta-lactamase regulating signal transducer with metallopeptidase domain
MTVIAQYLLKLSISLAFVYLFYAVVLRRLTFYAWNRWYLIGYSLLAFFIPFVNVSGLLQKNAWTNNKVVELIPVFDNYTKVIKQGQAPVTSSTPVNYWFFVLLFLLAGIAILGTRLLLQYFSYRRLRKAATLLSYGEVKVYQVNKPIIPFSFGSSVFINQDQHTDAELEKIIRHEFIHVKQRHTLDILWGEFLCIMNWYNPFAWMIRNAIRQNLEFIADNRVISEGADKKQYQYLLLKVVGTRGFSLSQQFNFSSLKKRIAMMNQVKSARLHLIRFLFILPLIAVLLLSFRNSIDRLLTVHSSPIILQQPPDENVGVQLHKPLQHLLYVNDTVPGPANNTLSRPPADSGKYIIDATLSKPGANQLGAISPVIRSLQNGDPLIIVDGVIWGGMSSIESLNPMDIQSINIFKGETAVGMYGQKARDGVIIILTKAAYQKFENADTLDRKVDSLFQNLNDYKGIVIVDDIDFSAQEMMNMHLPPNSIEAITIYQGDVAETRWGKKAANGVIQITTKAYKEHHHEYTDAERAAIEQDAQKHNILYIGVDNKIVIPGDPKKISIQFDDDNNLFVQSGDYTINPKKPGEVHIKFFKDQPDGSKKLIENRTYTVKYYPPPSSL